MNDKDNEVCKEHSGFIARIEGLEKASTDQWGELGTMDKRINTILTRLNILLGGVTVACIMLAVNILVKGTP